MSSPCHASFDVVAHPWGRGLRCGTLPPAAGHLFSTRDVDVRAEAAGVEAAWRAVATSLGVEPARLLRARQVHGCDVVAVHRGDGAPFEGPQPVADILVTDDPEVAVTVRVADCAPILIADARRGAVAAVHAGWRGTALGAARAGVEALGRAFGSQPADLHAAIGPSIGPAVYEVGEEVRAAFEAAGHGPAAIARWFRPGRHARPHLDVWQANVDQLVSAGVPLDRIACAGACTASNPEWFFSHRGQGGRAGRMVAAIRAFRPHA
jgi:hypothetical protein